VIRAQILLSTDKISFEEVTARIRQEATRWVAMGTFDQNPKSKAHAFSVHHFNAGKARVRGRLSDVLTARRVTIAKIGIGYSIRTSALSEEINNSQRQQREEGRKP
jgi:hypothetical protein